MLNILAETWDGPIKVNGAVYETAADAWEKFKDRPDAHLEIQLNFKTEPSTSEVGMPKPAEKSDVKDAQPQSIDGKVWLVTVRQYMTKPSSAEFDFHKKFNADVPMPWRTMVGEIIGETRGMYQMKLRGVLLQDPSSNCMVCGRTLTNPISFLTGIGPECAGRAHIPRAKIAQDILDQWSTYRQKVAEVEWTGWVIKSAITDREEFDPERHEAFAPPELQTAN